MDVDDTEGGPAAVIVSDPSAGMTPEGQSALLSTTGVNRSTAVAYVSFPPGTIANATSARITNRHNSLAFDVPLTDGGLDPVPVPADAGDTIAIAATGGSTLLEFTRLVPSFLPVRVVRTEPPSGKRDVPLNMRVRIVFSEPLDPSTVTDLTLLLEQNDVAVGGEIGVSGDGLEANLQPDVPLLPETDYTIRVDQAIQDADGDRLAVPVTSRFTTGTATGTAVALRFDRSPANAIAGMSMLSSVVVSATDAFGNPATGFRGDITLAIAENPGGGSLAGTTTRTARAFTEFDDLRVSGVGDGYTLIATSPGIGSVTSATFDVVSATDVIAFSTFLIQPATEHTPLSVIMGLYATTPDGRASARFRTPWYATEPSWSPDGNRLAFVRAGTFLREEESADPESESTLYVMNTDGSALSSLGLRGNYPAWSPDGEKLAFTSDGGIYVVNADGSGVAQLIADGSDAVWSPDGSRLAFTRVDGMYLMKSDGTGQTILHPGGGSPAWSADGTRIAFSAGNDIYVINADGSGLASLTGDHVGKPNYYPTWSSDGRLIAYASTDDFGETYFLYTMNADGSGRTRVHHSGGVVEFGAVRVPAWSPH